MSSRSISRCSLTVVCLALLLAACTSPSATATPAATATATRAALTPTPTSPTAAAPTATQPVASPTATSAPGGSPTVPAPTSTADAATPTALPATPTSAPATATVQPTATSAAAGTSTPGADTGTTEMRVTDKPPADVTKILIAASKIEAQRSGATGETGWSTIVDSPQPFDLVAVAGLEQVLGSSKLPVGAYGQVRLSITKATVTLSGKDVEATVPSDKLRVVGGFKVEAGKTTILTLDFDAEKSIVVAGSNIQLKPTVKLLTREPSDEPEPPSPGVLVVPMFELAASGQTGVATLTPKGSKTEVVVNVPPGAAGVAQPSHVHVGPCAQLGAVKYPLANVIDGKATTTIDVPLGALRTGGFAINIHKSTPDIAVSTSCGDIPVPEKSLTIELKQLGSSGESGWATLISQDTKTQVALSLAGGAAGVAQPAHIHEGTCEKLGAIKYPLADVKDGRSDSLVTVVLQALRTGAFAINVHKSAQDLATNMACGTIPSAPAES